MKPKDLLRFVRWLLDQIAHTEIVGAEQVPRSGAAIVVVNHLGLLDVPLGYLAVNREDATGWIADKHLRNPLYAYIVNAVQGVWLNRENPDLSSMKAALDFLKAGRLFAVAPEGTRSPTGALIEGKEGVAYLAMQSGAPIVPGGITGTEDGTQQLWRLRKPKLRIEFGTPFHLPKLDRARRQAQLKEGITEIMCRIAALLPEKYHGVYAGNPRIKELQSTAS